MNIYSKMLFSILIFSVFIVPVYCNIQKVEAARQKWIIFDLQMTPNDGSIQTINYRLDYYGCDTDTEPNYSLCKKLGNRMLTPTDSTVSFEAIASGVWKKYVFFEVAGISQDKKSKYINERKSYQKIDNIKVARNATDYTNSNKKTIVVKKDTSYIQNPDVPIPPPGTEPSKEEEISVFESDNNEYAIVTGTLNDDTTRPRLDSAKTEIYPNGSAKIILNWKPPQKTEGFKSYSIIMLTAVADTSGAGISYKDDLGNQINPHDTSLFEGVGSVDNISTTSFSKVVAGGKLYVMALKANYADGYTYSSMIDFDLIDPANPKMKLSSNNGVLATPDANSQKTDCDVQFSGGYIKSMMMQAFCGIVYALRDMAAGLYQNAVEWLKLSLGVADNTTISVPTSNDPTATSGNATVLPTTSVPVDSSIATDLNTLIGTEQKMFDAVIVAKEAPTAKDSQADITLKKESSGYSVIVSSPNKPNTNYNNFYAVFSPGNEKEYQIELVKNGDQYKLAQGAKIIFRTN